MDTLLTKLTQVTEAISSLAVSVSSASRASASCGCPGGSEPPTQGEFAEGDPPPAGWADTPDDVGTEGYQNRKCAVANVLHQWIISSLEGWQNAGLDDLAALGLAGAFGLVSEYLISTWLVGAVFPWVVLIVGAVAAVVTVLIYNSVDLSNLLSILNANEEDFVCALYSSASVSEAKDNYLQVADDNGVSSGNYALLEAIFFLDDVFGQLFFDPSDPERSAALELAISSLSGGIDCTACDCNSAVLLLGSINWETGVISSQADGGAHKVAIMFNTDSWAYDWLTTQLHNCGPMAVPEFGSITGGAPVSSYAFEVVSDDVTDLYASGSTMWANPGQHGRSFWIVRNAAFTVPLIGVSDYGG